MAFAHGIDSDGRRHFQRFSGERFTPGIRLVVLWRPFEPNRTVEVNQARNKMYQDVTVKSTLTPR